MRDRPAKNQSEKYEEIDISCYDNEIPLFVEQEMEHLYESIFSSIRQFNIYGAIDNASTYVARKNGKVVSIFLFLRENGKVQVINEVIYIDREEVERFVNYIFSTFPEVNIILFKSIHTNDTNVLRLRFPYQRVNYLEDIVLNLPGTTDKYMASLGKATRKTIKGYMNKLRRDFPSFTYRIFKYNELTEKQIRDIIKLNWARMAEKNTMSAYDEIETKRIIALAKIYGLVGVATIDGKICAGAVSYRVGNQYYMRISAHDPAYDNYRLGTLCGYLIISACIEEGGTACHLLWGQHEYKYRFLGVKHDLDNITVYRSHMHVLRHVDSILVATCKGYARCAEIWLHNVKQRDDILGHAAMSVIYFLKNLKRFGQVLR